MFNKLKKGLQDTKNKAARNYRYAVHKSQALEHPETVLEHIKQLKWNLETTPRIYERMKALAAIQLTCMDAEKKAISDFQLLGSGPHENKQTAAYYMAWAVCLEKTSTARMNYHAVLEDILSDFKVMKMHDLKMLDELHSRVSHALIDMRHWQKNGNSIKFLENEARYRQLVQELVILKNSYVQAREAKYSEYVKTWINAQRGFDQLSNEATQEFSAKVSQIGPVAITQFEPFVLPPSFSADEASPSSVHYDPAMEMTPAASHAPHEHAHGSPDVIGQPLNTPSPCWSAGDASSQRDRMEDNETPARTGPVVRNPESGRPTTLPVGTPMAASSRQSANFKVRAYFPFAATASDELSFERGDILTVKMKIGQWWLAELNGKEGLIPHNYVTPLEE